MGNKRYKFREDPVSVYCWCGREGVGSPLFVTVTDRPIGFAYCAEHRYQLTRRFPLIYMDGFGTHTKKLIDEVAQSAQKVDGLVYHSYYPVFDGVGYHTDQMERSLQNMWSELDTFVSGQHVVVNSPVYTVLRLPIEETRRYRLALRVFFRPTVWYVTDTSFYGTLTADVQRLEPPTVVRKIHIAPTKKAMWYLWNSAVRTSNQNQDKEDYENA